ncbi:MAG: FimB/Mfa2 family fimbrial subunit [Tannerella sp.]|jgi:hypothetical protein|nr:FimB/Mfa2 family fimbrial subunit [Tannerella sp.]
MKEMKYTYKKIRAALCLGLFALTFAACVSEESIYTDNENAAKTGETTVAFAIQVPSQTQAHSTKGVTDEGAVGRIHILLFEATGSRTLRQIVQVDDIAPGTGSQKTFQATLPVGTYDIVVLANAQEILNSNGVIFGAPKATVLGALVEKNTGKWDNSSIAMWGRRDGQTVSQGVSFTGGNAIRMIRMLAKIEVEVTPEAAGVNNSNFTLTDIRLYNYSSQGALVPDPGTWPSDDVAVQPTCPVVTGGYGAMTYPANSPLVFTSRVFYTYEAPAGGSGSAMKTSTCTVIGGSYRGRPTTYYRADFVDKDDPDEYLPLLRNHHYLVKIVKVNGDGFLTPEQAFEATHVNMEIEVLPWNSSSSDVVFDGQHSLEVSKSEYTFSNDAQTVMADANRLTIRTSVSDGWKVDEITNENGTPASWLTVSEQSFATPGVSKDIYVYANENTTGAKRTGYIYIRAGKLSFRVTVTQKEIFEMYITDVMGNEIDELVFPLTGNTSDLMKDFSVDWTPSTRAVSVSVAISGDEAFTGVGMPQNSTVITNGSKFYQVIANSYTGSDPVIYRSSKVDFTLTDGETIVTRTLFLRQYDYALMPVVDPYYFLDGETKKVGIRANTTWEVIGINDPDDIIANRSEVIGKTGGLNTSPEGEALYFDIADLTPGVSSLMSTATLVLRNALGNTYNVEIKSLAVYPVDDLLVWPVDETFESTDSWFTFTDVPFGIMSTDVPPAGTRNTTVDPRSCAAHDPSDKNLWRLPTETEIGAIIGHFRTNGGYAKYGMGNVDYSSGSGSYNGYLTASNLGPGLALIVAWNVSIDTTPGPMAIPAAKDNLGENVPTLLGGMVFHLHVRCVRNK